MRTLMSFFRNVFIVVAILIAIFLSPHTFGATWYVDGSASGTNSGTITNPWTSLQTALTSGSVSELDTILIAQGTYKATTGTDRTISFVIGTKNLILQGGWINNGGGSWSFSPATATTILSGDIGTGNADSYTVLRLSHSSSTTTATRIEHLTITSGYANGSGGATDPNSGGGVRITAGAPRLHKVKITENDADVAGGGVYTNGSSPVFTECTIQSNTIINGSGNGAGVYTTGGHARLINCVIKDNTGAVFGGGVATE